MVTDNSPRTPAENPKFSRAQISETVNSILAKLLDIDPNSIHDDTKMEADLGMDSIDFLELMEHLEDKFGEFNFDIRRMGKYARQPTVLTVSDLVTLFEQYFEKGDAFLTQFEDQKPSP